MKQELVEAGLSGVGGHWVSSDAHPDVRKLLDRLAPGTLIASRMAWLQATEHIEDPVLVAQAGGSEQLDEQIMLARSLSSWTKNWSDCQQAKSRALRLVR